MHPAIGKHRASIAVICRRGGVSRLEGLALRFMTTMQRAATWAACEVGCRRFWGARQVWLTAQDLTAWFTTLAIEKA
ncbi:MAG: hypothetical protein WAV85_01330 [Rhodoferax sp.]